jgi:hypothetical protein
MPNDDRTWFITERSEALASLMLTSRSDVTVESESKNDDGVDFVVAVNDAEGPPTRLFVVQVKGTTSSDKGEWTESVKQLYKPGRFYLPACVFIINIRSNEATYAWVAEPQVEGKSARLGFFEHPDFHSLDRDAVDHIVNRGRQWYDAIPRSVKTQAS